MPYDGAPVTDVPEEKSIFHLLHGGLPTMVSHAIKHTGKGVLGSIMDMAKNVTSRLGDRLRHFGYGHPVGNETIRHEVELAVSGAMHDLNITDDANGTFQNALVSELDQEIELEALGQVIMTTTENWRAQDFFHKMPMKDETLFVSMICMGIIVPIIIFALFGIYMYKRRRDHKRRMQDMLLRDFSMEDKTPDEHKGNVGEDVQDLDFRTGYQT